MPDQEFNQDGAEINLDVLLTKSKWQDDLKIYIDHIGDYWYSIYTNKHNRQPRLPNIREMKLILNVLRPDIQSVFTLNSILNSVEQEQVNLTEEQCRILQRLDNNQRTIVEGGAGTGKTILAIDKSLRLSKEGKKVLYLCYNRLLGDHVRNWIKLRKNDEYFEAWSIHSWFNHILGKIKHIYSNNVNNNQADTFFDEIYPQKYIEALVELDFEPFDVIIIDEGQDLMKEGYLEAIDLTLKNGLEKGNWHIFWDPLQNIFHTEHNEIIEKLTDFGAVHYSLSINCRNTREIALATAIFSGIDQTLEGAIEGGIQKYIYYRSDDELISLLEKNIIFLLEDGLRKKDIIILSTSKLANSKLSGNSKIAGLRLNDLTETRISNKNTLDYCTIQGFKGLDRRAVLAIDFNSLMSMESRYLHYCGLSRARSYLAVFVNEKDKIFIQQTFDGIWKTTWENFSLITIK